VCQHLAAVYAQALGASAAPAGGSSLTHAP